MLLHGFTPTLTLMELLAIRLSPQAGKSLVIPHQGGGDDVAESKLGGIFPFIPTFPFFSGCYRSVVPVRLAFR
jgi:hypothetical protein